MSESDGETTTSWISVRVEPSGNSGKLTALLFAAGSLGVQEDGPALVTHFPSGTRTDDLVRDLMDADPRARVTIGLAPRIVWSEWKASVRAHQLGALTIAPPWLAGEADPATAIIIEPAMAFGTGEHATTRGVTRLMQTLSPMPLNVADLGSGSAVLSICAAKLGARRVIAIELDEDAIGNAEENVAANGVGGIVHVIHGDAAVVLPLVAPVDLVLANIISSVLTGLLPTIADSLSSGGSAILSGILEEERVTMLAEVEKGRWRLVAEDREDGWWSVLIERR